MEASKSKRKLPETVDGPISPKRRSTVPSPKSGAHRHRKQANSNQRVLADDGFVNPNPNLAKSIGKATSSHQPQAYDNSNPNLPKSSSAFKPSRNYPLRSQATATTCLKKTRQVFAVCSTDCQFVRQIARELLLVVPKMDDSYDMKSKMEVMLQSVIKIENACFSVHVRGSEYIPLLGDHAPTSYLLGAAEVIKKFFSLPKEDQWCA